MWCQQWCQLWCQLWFSENHCFYTFWHFSLNPASFTVRNRHFSLTPQPTPQWHHCGRLWPHCGRLWPHCGRLWPHCGPNSRKSAKFTEKCENTVKPRGVGDPDPYHGYPPWSAPPVPRVPPPVPPPHPVTSCYRPWCLRGADRFTRLLLDTVKDSKYRLV